MVEEGADTFKAKVNIEVQLASELAIAAIEKNGGVVTTAFYDPRSLGKLVLSGLESTASPGLDLFRHLGSCFGNFC